MPGWLRYVNGNYPKDKGYRLQAARNAGAGRWDCNEHRSRLFRDVGSVEGREIKAC